MRKGHDVRPAERGAGWSGRRRSRVLSFGAVAAVAAVAVAAVVGLIWLGQSGPGRPSADVATAGRAKGDLAAPVVIEEWGDFQ